MSIVGFHAEWRRGFAPRTPATHQINQRREFQIIQWGEFQMIFDSNPFFTEEVSGCLNAYSATHTESSQARAGT